MQKQRACFAVGLVFFFAMSLRADAHAFMVCAQPRVGSKLDKAPTEVRIWFSEPLESASSTIKVFDQNGKQVDKKDTQLDRDNHALLALSLVSGLRHGIYRVSWRVISVDTHVTTDDFRFQILP
jgi:methionine-rich copper-binding protein CopC